MLLLLCYAMLPLAAFMLSPPLRRHCLILFASCYATNSAAVAMPLRRRAFFSRYAAIRLRHIAVIDAAMLISIFFD